MVRSYTVDSRAVDGFERTLSDRSRLTRRQKEARISNLAKSLIPDDNGLRYINRRNGNQPCYLVSDPTDPSHIIDTVLTLEEATSRGYI